MLCITSTPNRIPAQKRGMWSKVPRTATGLKVQWIGCLLVLLSLSYNNGGYCGAEGLGLGLNFKGSNPTSVWLWADNSMSVWCFSFLILKWGERYNGINSFFWARLRVQSVHMSDVPVRCLALTGLQLLLSLLQLWFVKSQKLWSWSREQRILVRGGILRISQQRNFLSRGSAACLSSSDRGLPPYKEHHDEIDQLVDRFHTLRKSLVSQRLPPSLVPAPPWVSRGQPLTRVWR